MFSMVGHLLTPEDARPAGKVPPQGFWAETASSLGLAGGLLQGLQWTLREHGCRWLLSRGSGGETGTRPWQLTPEAPSSCLGDGTPGVDTGVLRIS